tara:strand:+ start:1144 stop:1332 length:189 start_codon:yes stop_codon:yes gene_type:complete
VEDANADAVDAIVERNLESIATVEAVLSLVVASADAVVASADAVVESADAVVARAVADKYII